MSHSVVKFLTRPGCHLCDVARPLVEREVARRSLDLEEIDIDQDDHLVAEYGLRIPVVLWGGQVLAEGEIGRRSLRRGLKRLGQEH
ncbi:MAG: glutaredoxin family protein [Acidimicrobiia bacterium]